MTIKFGIESGGSRRARMAVLDLVEKELAECGLPYSTTTDGLLIEGELDRALSVIQRCHDSARVHHSKVKTWFHVQQPA